jgi:hypothetical protein
MKPRSVQSQLADLRPFFARVDRGDALLDISRKQGVDEHAATMASSPEILRSAVATAGKVAVALAYGELVERTRAHERAKRLTKLVAYVAKESAEFQRDPEMAMWGFASDAPGLLEDLARVSGAHLEIAKPPSSRQEPLASIFVSAMVHQYRRTHGGAHPPTTRGGPFARLLAAGWRDLNFPLPSEDIDLVRYLGRRLVDCLKS